MTMAPRELLQIAFPEADLGYPTISKTPTSIGAFIGTTQTGPLNQPVRLNGVADFLAVFGEFDPAHEVGYAISQFFKNGGQEAWFVRIERDVRAFHFIGDASARTGLYALDWVDLFNLLCIPGLAGLPDGELCSAVVAISQYCQNRRVFFLFDPPAGITDPNTLKHWLSEHESLRHPNIASFFPRLKIVDPLNMNLHRMVGPAATVAGALVRNDLNHNVWTEPSGGDLPLLGVIGLEYDVSEAELALLNSLGVNGIRKFGEFGTVIAGSKTTIGIEKFNSDWCSIPARRLALMIQESLYRGTEWVSAKSNDTRLWTDLRRQVNEFMGQLYRERAFQGEDSSQAFFVKCDDQLNPLQDQSRNLVNLLVGFAPSLPGKFVMLKLRRRVRKAS